MLGTLRRQLTTLGLALTLLTLSGSPAVFAASASEAQNADFTVSLTVPDEASVGQTVAATIVISNNTPRLQTITVRGVWTDPEGGETVTTRSGLLLPGQTLTRVVDYQVTETSVAGTHTVSVSVENRNGASTATTFVQVV